MTVRNRTHSRIMARVAQVLNNWLDQQPEPRGSVLCGEVGVRMRNGPDSTVGVDVAYLSAEVAARQSDDTTLVEGVPVLAVEILSPNDRQEDIEEKTDDYLAAGVALVWVINPYRRTVLIVRPGAEPELVNALQELTAEPHLTGQDRACGEAGLSGEANGSACDIVMQQPSGASNQARRREWRRVAGELAARAAEQRQQHDGDGKHDLTRR